MKSQGANSAIYMILQSDAMAAMKVSGVYEMRALYASGNDGIATYAAGAKFLNVQDTL